MGAITLKVVSSTGTPVVGASIYTSEDTARRLTDVQGEYTQTVPDGWAKVVSIVVETADGNSRASGTKVMRDGEIVEFLI